MARKTGRLNLPQEQDSGCPKDPPNDVTDDFKQWFDIAPRHPFELTESEKSEVRRLMKLGLPFYSILEKAGIAPQLLNELLAVFHEDNERAKIIANGFYRSLGLSDAEIIELKRRSILKLPVKDLLNFDRVRKFQKKKDEQEEEPECSDDYEDDNDEED